MPKWALNNQGSVSKAEQKEWEEAMEAVLRDITAAAPPVVRRGIQRSPQLVQIVIYESSV